MLKVKINKNRNGKMNKLIKAVKKELDGATIEVGHFQEQGQHPTAGMSFVQLMAFHNDPARFPELGGDGVPARRVLDILRHELDGRVGDIPVIKTAIEMLQANPSPKMAREVLDTIGQAIAEKEERIFGSDRLSPTPKNPDPLIDTGALRDSIAYRINGGELNNA